MSHFQVVQHFHGTELVLHELLLQNFSQRLLSFTPFLATTQNIYAFP